LQAVLKNQFKKDVGMKEADS